MFSPGSTTGLTARTRGVARLALLAGGFFASAAFTNGSNDPEVAVDTTYREWMELVQTHEDLAAEAYRDASVSLVSRLFALDRIAAGVLDGTWPDLSEVEKRDFKASLSLALVNEASEFISDDGRGSSLTLTGSESVDGTTSLAYSLGEGQPVLTLTMIQADTAWQVIDVAVDGSSMVDHYREYASDLLEDYSFPYMVAELGNLPFVNLEDFESSTPGELPLYWTWKDSDNDKHKPYRIVREGDNQYLEATDEGESVILGRDLRWNLREFPYVSFRVRVNRIPEGADERYDSRVDSGAGIYFIYRKLVGLIPESVKYVWSSTQPVGAAMRRKGVGRPWMVAIGSGSDGLGEWRTYVFDLGQAYRDTFGRRPPRKTVGIGILSDANSMHSFAYADYDDIRALREAPEGVTSGVEQILETYQQ